jgi:hypothetical protein
MCHYQNPSSNNDWLVHNELEWAWNEVITACLKHYCNLRLKRLGKADKNPSDWLGPWPRFKQGIAICTNSFSIFEQ